MKNKLQFCELIFCGHGILYINIELYNYKMIYNKYLTTSNKKGL